MTVVRVFEQFGCMLVLSLDYTVKYRLPFYEYYAYTCRLQTRGPRRIFSQCTWGGWIFLIGRKGPCFHRENSIYYKQLRPVMRGASKMHSLWV